MLITEQDKIVCAKYKKGQDGHAHCNECPLLASAYYLMCKANSHYDEKRQIWLLDEGGDGTDE